MKTKANVVTNEYMKSLQEATGLGFDGGANEDRLFTETIHTFSKDMNEVEYNTMEKNIDQYFFQGTGFQVYAWNDSSGYDYWNVKQQEDNYIQVTIAVTGDNADPVEIKKAADLAHNHFSKYSRY